MHIKDSLAVTISVIFAVLSACTLIFSLPSVAAYILVGLVDIYLVLVLIECALRSSRSGPWSKVFLPLPHRAWAFLQLFLLTFTIVAAFAHLFLSCNEVRHMIRDVSELGTDEYSDQLDGPAEAFYFSMVTITTLGYGEFSPGGPTARWLIVAELTSGMLILVLAFPLVSSRATVRDMPAIAP